MARSLNRCEFIGNLGADVDIRYMPNGNAVANFSIGVADDYQDKQSGQKVERSEWVRCVAYAKLGEICGEYLRKGSKVFVEGKFKTRSWEKDGVKHYATEIELINMQMLDSRQGAQQGDQQSQQQRQAHPQQSAARQPAPRPQQQQQQSQQGANGPNTESFDDDIPFVGLHHLCGA